MKGTRRQQAIREALRALIPQAPMADFAPIVESALGAHLRTLPPGIAAWLAVTAHVRHAHTDYDDLLAEGYDRDAARFFVRDRMQEVLTGWGCRRTIDDSDQDAS